MAPRRRRNGDRSGAEQIHLPSNSTLPMWTAVGLTVALLGLILSWPFVAAGGAITLLAIWRWIKKAREEYEALPRER
jgi:hypothetical protein